MAPPRLRRDSLQALLQLGDRHGAGRNRELSGHRRTDSPRARALHRREKLCNAIGFPGNPFAADAPSPHRVERPAWHAQLMSRQRWPILKRVSRPRRIQISSARDRASPRAQRAPPRRRFRQACTECPSSEDFPTAAPRIPTSSSTTISLHGRSSANGSEMRTAAPRLPLCRAVSLSDSALCSSMSF